MADLLYQNGRVTEDAITWYKNVISPVLWLKMLQKFKKVYFECFARKTNGCVYASCNNNQNNMSYSTTGCLILKVPIWGINFAREEYLQSF